MNLTLRAFVARNITERLRGWAHWAAPYRALWLREKADHAVTRGERDRAIDIAAALTDHPVAGWTEDDDAWLRTLGERPA